MFLFSLVSSSHSSSSPSRLLLAFSLLVSVLFCLSLLQSSLSSALSSSALLSSLCLSDSVRDSCLSLLSLSSASYLLVSSSSSCLSLIGSSPPPRFLGSLLQLVSSRLLTRSLSDLVSSLVSVIPLYVSLSSLSAARFSPRHLLLSLCLLCLESSPLLLLSSSIFPVSLPSFFFFSLSLSSPFRAAACFSQRTGIPSAVAPIFSLSNFSLVSTVSASPRPCGAPSCRAPSAPVLLDSPTSSSDSVRASPPCSAVRLLSPSTLYRLSPGSYRSALSDPAQASLSSLPLLLHLLISLLSSLLFLFSLLFPLSLSLCSFSLFLPASSVFLSSHLLLPLPIVPLLSLSSLALLSLSLSLSLTLILLLSLSLSISSESLSEVMLPELVPSDSDSSTCAMKGRLLSLGLSSSWLSLWGGFLGATSWCITTRIIAADRM
ncbi:hypothetical protein C7M84_005674 [Penaeus vannamei]|uniref:Transmembrane protein n=1 Tax=Penaeus vannamei TaxID=6689 RepID=A0A3R7PLI2_PENVA|nr:hypothetical protein C7M84_005674 [Penaeus vannamei]